MPKATWIQLYNQLEDLPDTLGILFGGHWQRLTMLSISAAYQLADTQIAYELNEDGVIRTAAREAQIFYTTNADELHRHEADRLMVFLLKELM